MLNLICITFSHSVNKMSCRKHENVHLRLKIICRISRSLIIPETILKCKYSFPAPQQFLHFDYAVNFVWGGFEEGL